MTKIWAFVAVSSIALVAGMPAAAQEVATPADETEIVGAGDIVVTAQKRSESINRVPISVTAVGGDDLVQRGITSTADLAKVVPGFTFTPSQYNSPVYSIRGIGFYETSLSATPAVTVYTDEIPLPFPAMTKAASLDLERVEVLKGPQGTLFGHNSTGGAVNYVAAKPTDTLTGGFNASFGRFATFDGQAFVSGPIADTLTFRIAARATVGGDWQKSYTRDEGNGAQNQYQARLLLDWQPSERLHFVVNINGFSDTGDTQAPSLIAITPQFPEKPAPFLNYPLAPLTSRAADWTPGLPKRNDKFYQLSLRGDYEISDALTLTNITSYEHFRTRAGIDFDGTSFQVIDAVTDGKITSFSQELRLTGDVGRFKWIVGGNFQRDKVRDSQDLFLPDSTQTPTFPGITPPWSRASNFSIQNVKTYAAFANLEVEVLDNVKLQGGVRYTDARRDFTGCSLGDRGLSDSFEFLQLALNSAVFGVPSFVSIPTDSCITLGPIGTSAENSFLPTLTNAELDEDNISWRAGLDWQASPTTLLYANVSKGYKSGSFPTLSAGTVDQYVPVVQESVLAYEAGLKAGLFDKRAQLNTAFFYYDYQNKQFRGKFISPTFGVIDGLTNVPKSRVWGVEASLQAEPIEGLTANLAGTYLNSKIQDYRGIGSTGTLDDFSGNSYPYTPDWQLQSDLQYEWNVGGDLSAFVGGSAVHNSSTNGSLGAEALTRIKGYTVLDLRAGIANDAQQWRLTIWGRNVTDEYYWTNALRGGDTAFRYNAMPATWGVTFSKKFG